MSEVKKKLFRTFLIVKFRLLSMYSAEKAAQQSFLLFTSPRLRVQLPPAAPFIDAQSGKFELQGNIIRGYRWNIGASKKVLLLHGFDSSIQKFGAYIDPLVAKGYEVIAYDAPAHGYSEGEQLDILMYQEFIKEIINIHGPIHAFIAHSFGGISLLLALEQLKIQEKYKVVLIAPLMETSTAIKAFVEFIKLPQKTQTKFEALITKKGGHPSSWFSINRVAAGIKAEVLFLQDKEDRQTPYADVVPLMEKKYSNFHFIITEGLGHSRIYLSENSLNKIVSFL